MPDALNYYLKKIERLRVDRTHSRPAPHKPLLLLAAIDLIEDGSAANNKFEPSPRFVETFLKYWRAISSERPRIFLPFFHLKSDGLWHLTAKPGLENELQTTRQIGSMAQLARLIDFAKFDDELFVLLCNSSTREIFRAKILDTYFSDQIEIFRTLIDETREISGIENLLLRSAEDKSPEIIREIIDTPKRSIAFRRAIIRLYDYTCAACRYRIITSDGETAVEAAHIYPFAQSYDDSIGNGLSLCPLHHWAFDKGLFSIDDRYQMIVSKNFEESGEDAFLLRALQNKEILMPKEKPFRPSLTMIRWHRQNTFSS